MPAVRKLLNDLSELGIRVAQWTNYIDEAQGTPEAHSYSAFSFLGPVAKLFGMGLVRTSWVKLNRLRACVRRFHSSTYK